MRPEELLDLNETEHAEVFDADAAVWEVLPRLAEYVQGLVGRGERAVVERRREFPGAFIGEQVVIGEGTRIAPGAVLVGPAWLGRNCEVRPGAFVREHVVVGDGCVLGNSSEFKNCLLFNGCQVPHYSYVGDSVLGYKAHLGAGAILSNFKLAGDEVSVWIDGVKRGTGLRKMGAIVGDRAEIGCQAVLNPGSLIGRGSVIYPGVVWRGTLGARCLVKPRVGLEVQERVEGKK